MAEKDRIIWENVEFLRAKKGWSYADLGRKIGSKPQVLNGIKVGKGIGPAMLRKFAQVFQVEESKLLEKGWAAKPEITPLAGPDEGTEIGKAVGCLIKILQSGDSSIVSAIVANLNTFSRTIDLKGEIEELKRQHLEFKNELATLKNKIGIIQVAFLAEAERRPNDTPERRSLNKKLSEVLGTRKGDGDQ